MPIIRVPVSDAAPVKTVLWLMLYLFPVALDTAILSFPWLFIIGILRLFGAEQEPGLIAILVWVISPILAVTVTEEIFKDASSDELLNLKRSGYLDDRDYTSGEDTDQNSRARFLDLRRAIDLGLFIFIPAALVMLCAYTVPMLAAPVLFLKAALMVWRIAGRGKRRVTSSGLLAASGVYTLFFTAMMIAFQTHPVAGWSRVFSVKSSTLEPTKAAPIQSPQNKPLKKLP